MAIGALRKLSGNRAEIKRMRVHPVYQRRGFGQQILILLLEKASESGYTELCLNTTGQMLPAQRLYEKFGFVRERSEKIGRQVVIFYEKKLNSQV